MLVHLIALWLFWFPLCASAHVESHIHAAKVLFEEGVQAAAEKQSQQAAAYFLKAIAIEPTFLEARRALINVYSSVGDSLHEASAITEYLEIKPESNAYHIRLGQLLLDQKQPPKALAQFVLALKYDPDNAEALLGFASAASLLGMQARADQAIARGRQRYPSDLRFQSQHP